MDKLPKGWKTLKINEVCTFRPAKKEVSKLKDIQVSFVPMATVKERKMFFNTSEVKDIQEVYKGYTYFQNNDVLLAKVTPCFENGKSAIAKNLKNGIGFGSSEFYVLRPNEGILPEWIYRNISNSDFLLLGKNHMSGAVGLQRLTQNFLLNFKISVPPLPEQKRIVSKLDALFERIDKSIALLEENIKQTEALMASVLNKVFEQELIKAPRKPLNEIANVARGKSKHRPRNDKRLFGGNYPFIQTGDVRNAKKYIQNYSAAYSEFGLSQSKLWKKNTICLTIAANIGDVAILAIDACFPDSVVGITSNKMHHKFLYYYLKTLQTQLDKMANSAAQKNINLKILSSIEVPVPDFIVQKNIGDRISEIENKQTKILNEQQDKLSNLKALKESILDKAFKGEL